MLSNGKGALSGAFDGTVRLWDIPEPATPLASEIDVEGTGHPPASYQKALAWVNTFRRDRGDLGAGPTCFISYAWGDADHVRWVERLADHLKDAGVSVILDRWHNTPGTDIDRFIERIEGSDFICAVGTPAYRLKDQAQDADAVVQAELGLIKSRRMQRDDIRRTVISLLREGTPATALPPLLRNSVFVDFRRDPEYFLRLFELLSTIHRIPFEDRTARQHRDALQIGSTPPMAREQPSSRVGHPSWAKPNSTSSQRVTRESDVGTSTATFWSRSPSRFATS